MGGKYQISLCPTTAPLALSTRPILTTSATTTCIEHSSIHMLNSFPSFFITLVNWWLIYKHLKGDKGYTYHSYLRDLAETLAWAGGHHQKQEHPHAQLSKLVIPQAVHQVQRQKGLPLTGSAKINEDLTFNLMLSNACC